MAYTFSEHTDMIFVFGFLTAIVGIVLGYIAKDIHIVKFSTIRPFLKFERRQFGQFKAWKNNYLYPLQARTPDLEKENS